MTEVVQQRGKTGIKRILKGKQGLSFWQEALDLVSAFSLGSKAGDLQEPSAGEDSQLVLVVAGLHVFDEVGR